jgi:hypothetical protein
MNNDRKGYAEARYIVKPVEQTQSIDNANKQSLTKL